MSPGVQGSAKPVSAENNFCADSLLNYTSSLQLAYVLLVVLVLLVLLALHHQIPNAITCAHVLLIESMQSHWSHPQPQSQSTSHGLVQVTKYAKGLPNHIPGHTGNFSRRKFQAFSSFVVICCCEFWCNYCVTNITQCQNSSHRDHMPHCLQIITLCQNSSHRHQIPTLQDPPSRKPSCSVCITNKYLAGAQMLFLPMKDGG